MKLQSIQRVSFLLGFLLCAYPLSLLAQDPIQPEGIPPESDWLYRKHYAQIQEILKLPSIQEREKRLDAYMKKLNPKNKALKYMESFFAQIVKAYQQAGQTSEADALTARMARLFPNSSAQLARSFQTAFQDKDYAKAIQVGEKIYAGNPDPQVAIMLAQSYMATNNTAKSRDYSLKVVKAIGPKKGVYFLAWLADYYARQQDVAKASQYYGQLLQSYPGGAPAGWDPERWKQVKATAYTVRAGNAYVHKDYASAIQSYNESLKYSPHDDSTYLYLGLSHWRSNKLDQAIEAFAKAVVLNKSSSAKAREYLEQLYKPRNNNSLEGLDALLVKARTALNL
ncbi:MAG: tetratricopeptide repeat protein [Acidobacteriota bacterium]